MPAHTQAHSCEKAPSCGAGCSGGVESGLRLILVSDGSMQQHGVHHVAEPGAARLCTGCEERRHVPPAWLPSHRHIAL